MRWLVAQKRIVLTGIVMVQVAHFFCVFLKKSVGAVEGGFWPVCGVFLRGFGKSGRILMVFCGEFVVFLW
jgi:hypothetical protein